LVGKSLVLTSLLVTRAPLDSDSDQSPVGVTNDPSGLYCMKQYWYCLAPYGADVDDR